MAWLGKPRSPRWGSFVAFLSGTDPAEPSQKPPGWVRRILAGRDIKATRIKNGSDSQTLRWPSDIDSGQRLRVAAW